MLEWFIFHRIVNKTDLREEYKHMFFWRKDIAEVLAKNDFFSLQVAYNNKSKKHFLINNLKKNPSSFNLKIAGI